MSLQNPLPVAVAIDHRLLIDRLDHFGFLFFRVRNSATWRAARVNFADTLDYFLQLIAGCSGTYGTAALIRNTLQQRLLA